MISGIRDASQRGAVLVFLPGEHEIQTVKRELMRSKLGNLEILPLHSRMPFEDAQ